MTLAGQGENLNLVGFSTISRLSGLEISVLAAASSVLFLSGGSEGGGFSLRVPSPDA
jgi:hypothetical protein